MSFQVLIYFFLLIEYLKEFNLVTNSYSAINYKKELDYINKQLMILDAKTPEEEAELIERFNKELESKTEE